LNFRAGLTIAARYSSRNRWTKGREGADEMKTETIMVPEPMATRVELHPFLAGMNRTQLALLTDCAIAIRFKKEQTIFREGEPANRFYLLESGKVILESGAGLGDPVVIDTIGAGDLLGWSWMFPPYTWHFTARAVEPTEALFFYGTILREYCEKDHSLGYELLKRMTVVMNRRMQAARNKMLAVHQGSATLEPAALESPFLDQELDASPDSD
jgi:CRP/FNR family transcriptional regulator, cyclic AMP receptor protein